MSLLSKLQNILESHHIWAKKQFGQNFLINEKVYEDILSSAELSPSDVVIEVGPGTGFLTERLISDAKQVMVIEKDVDMINVLNERFSDASNLEIIHDDILQFDISNIKSDKYKVVANIPYYITSPILRFFLQSSNPPTRMVLLVQKEVAEKICNKKHKSVLALDTQIFGDPKIIAMVPPESFHPAPKVDSAVIQIDVFDKPLIPEEDLPLFFKIIHHCFSQKRKKIRNTLAQYLQLKTQDLDGKFSFSVESRPEALNVRDWLEVIEFVKKV